MVIKHFFGIYYMKTVFNSILFIASLPVVFIVFSICAVVDCMYSESWCGLTDIMLIRFIVSILYLPVIWVKAVFTIIHGVLT